MSYDRNVSDAKQRTTAALMEKDLDRVSIGRAFDELNAAWDALTDALVRQRAIRDKQILSLLDQLAEAKR